MGNILTLEGGGNERIAVNVKKREYRVIDINIPYNQLAMIRVLQKEFDYEVKGTIYVDHDYEFKSFEVRTDGSELYSYGASDWRISFHTHPDNTAKKYGVRYYSPPSPEDVLEIYDHNLRYVPDTTQSGFGEISIIFANEGIYILQVNRDSFSEFNRDNLPIEGLEDILGQTLTEYLVAEVKRGIYDTVDGVSVNTSTSPRPVRKPRIRKRHGKRTDVNMDDPDISVEQFAKVVKRVSRKVSEAYGFDMSFHSWPELEADGLNLKVCNYFLNKKVVD